MIIFEAIWQDIFFSGIFKADFFLNLRLQISIVWQVSLKNYSFYGLSL